MEQDDLTGATIYDDSGDRVGKIEETYKDGDGTARYARIKIGTLLAKHRIVPIDAAERTADGIKVPYSKNAIENAPDLPDDVNPLSGMVAEDLRGYYAGIETSEPPQSSSRDNVSRDATSPPQGKREDVAGDGIPSASDGDREEIGGVRDRGDVIEIPVVAERLVKEPVVTEVIRVRKAQVGGEERTVSADLRKEDVQVESEGDTPVHEVDRES